MDETVHPSESWLPSCVPEDDPSCPKDVDHSTTYTQLKNACPTSSGINVNVLKGTEVDIINLEQKDSNVRNLRPHSTPATLLWLEENYETAEGVCIPRSTLYMHYVDFCERNGMQPVNAASFGKIIRQQFPHLTTRRLGTRGQSRYHYYGIAVKESSSYYDVSYSKRGCGSIHENKKEPMKQASNYSQRTKIGTLLPDFTHFKDLNLPPNIPEEKVSTFLMMYRTHCQRILDTVISASFEEVQNFLLHFWKGMPSHISSILSSNAIVNMIGVCDSFVYKAISNVLFPSVHQALPDSLIQVVRKFSKDLTIWLRMALDDAPENLRALKFDLAKCFSRTLRRQTSLNHLCQASRMVIHNTDITSQMLQDWRNVDLDGISRQILFTMDGQNHSGATIELITNLYKEFETLLEEQAPIEAFMEWLESLVDRCVVQPSRKCKSSVRRLARQFLLMWSSFGTRVIRDMTLHSAPSFGSFHLLHLTFDDYVLFLVESLHWEERTQELFANIPSDSPPNLNDMMLDDAVVDAEIGMCKLRWQQQQQQQPHGGSSAQSLSMPSPSSHSHASSNNDIIGQNSPAPNVMDPTTPMSEDADVQDGGETAGQMMGEYTSLNQDHYSSTGYHYGGGHDTRGGGGYNYNTTGGTTSRQDSRNYPGHQGNQYVMNSGAGVDVQPVECAGRNVINGGTRNGEVIGNGVDYSNFVQYPTGRRGGDYPDCHGYVYEQPAPSIIYTTPTNCYYQPYDGSGGSAAVYCAPRYSVRGGGEGGLSKERLDSKMEEGMAGVVYGVTSPGNGRG